MKKIIFLLFMYCLLVTNMAVAEVNIPQGSVWSYYITVESSVTFTRYKVDGEETVNGKVYRTIYQFEDCFYSSESSLYVGCFREEDGKIYVPKERFKHLDWLPCSGDNEILLYDFTLNVGDTFRGENNAEYQVAAVEMVEINGKQRKKILLDGDSKDCWIEGVGTLYQQLLAPLAPLSNSSNYTLNVFNDPDGKTLYCAPFINEEEDEQILDTYKEDCLYNPQKIKNGLFIGEGTKWTEVRYRDAQMGSMFGPLWYESYYELREGKFIGVDYYWALYQDGEQIGLMREDSEYNIYLRDWCKFSEDTPEEFLLYSFTKPWEVGDVVRYAYLGRDIELGESILTEVEHILLENGETVPMVSAGWSYIIYGVGNSEGIIEGISPIPTDGSSSALLEYYRGGELIYRNHNVVSISSVKAEERLLIEKKDGEVRFTLFTMDNTDAQLLIYSLNGQILEQYPMLSGTVTVKGLSTGIYIYSLIVNNQEVDSKRMILTN